VKVGSLFTGYGGLDMAVGGDLAWYSEIEPAACTVLAAHYPDVPNLGDITAVDWSAVEPVDVITGGYPCQPFSHAGKRKGTKDERHLWPYVRDAISALRPSLAVLENVRGHLSLGLADVIGDLAGLGYDARWGVVRASDAGAPHGRARVFIVAQDATSGGSQGSVWQTTSVSQPKSEVGSIRPDRSGDRTVANTSGERHGCRKDPTVVVGLDRKDRRSWSKPEHLGQAIDWREYAPAINEWQPLIGRPVPNPTVRHKDRDRLNPVFVEWMMGLPEGHVTGHGLSAAQELKMLGNGVVPQQAALALRLLGVR
jgi:DNA (cytosine-5)-methyltransferase 1